MGKVTGGKVEANNIVGVLNEADKQNLVEAAEEIQQLLEQLSKTYPAETTKQKMKLAGEAIDLIENNPTLTHKILSAIKAGGIQALEQTLNHPVASFIMGAIEDFQEK
ncbi:MAG: hypothetical protein F6J96_21110 [Symploca sp. SIO1C2]|nr:hypothetical protein [Symploca sp. SIO1C2]